MNNAAFIDDFLASDKGKPFADIRKDAQDILVAFIDAAARGPAELEEASVEAAMVSVVPRMKKQRLGDAPELFSKFLEYAGEKAALKSAAALAGMAKRRAKELAIEDEKKRQPVKVTAPTAGRNDPCPCGSGKKYKKCCAT